jgi:hypothetical protein
MVGDICFFELLVGLLSLIVGPRHYGILPENAMDHIDGRLMGEMSAKIHDRDSHYISARRAIAQQNIIVDLIRHRILGRP